MKMRQIVDKTSSEILSEVLLLKRELMNLRFRKKAGELSNTARFKVVRKLVARFKTALAERSRKIDMNKGN
ncbi:50S ribosomal protein L29 [Rickettsiales endosymbiont of Peranema trichophorum]|uniref:50S ribosomal protein L29 n=1 Tax=Rickettsiales endosymbiont of Peranema trichophorum TaxID=2486577 RepID=UPI001023B4FD|nr:50S ribosomal protein L29 [Rickettsiales endosymbiont of Peranema trichophorum]RZI45566.1 50S ribosomal protein L29 [Rickettsiales endosymbiont of Peranema trichophorum]